MAYRPMNCDVCDKVLDEKMFEKFTFNDVNFRFCKWCLSLGNNDLIDKIKKINEK